MASLLACAQFAAAAEFRITHLGDTGAGSIAEAINAANAAPGADTIVYDVPAGGSFTILRSPLPTITGPLTITGLNPQFALTRDNAAGTPNFPILTVAGAGSVTIRNITLSNGKGTSGGGISATGASLALEGVTITNCFATASGGGLYLRSSGPASLSIVRCSIVSTQSGDSGGGVAFICDAGTATLTITDSTIAKNSIVTKSAGKHGAGVYLAGPGTHQATLTSSTLADNAIATLGSGGGMHIESTGGALSLTNCTISGNLAGAGAALSFTQTSASLASCTVYANNSASDANAGVILNTSGTLISSNTIISGNVSGGGVRDLAPSQPLSGNNNLVGIGGSLTSGVNGNIVGVTDPRLVPMGDNGGPTQTFSLRPGSPALDAGAVSGVPAVDQRGQPRPSDGDNNGVAVCDIGAFETQRFLVVNTNDSGTGSLRDAIVQNNAAGGGFVKFAIGTPGQTRLITPAASLNPITRTIFLDAWSQGGNDYKGLPLIELSGAAMATGVGLDVRANDCVIRGLSIGNFAGSSGNASGIGIRLSTGAAISNWIYANHIGVAPDGVTTRPNAQAGLWLLPSANTNRIGSNADGVDDALEKNVIGGSTQGVASGIYIQANSNIVTGNHIGLNATGAAAIASGTGVRIVAGTSNRIGALASSAFPAAERNIISGNTQHGISLSSSGSNNNIAGNYVGLAPDGVTARPNGVGIHLDNVMLSLIGGPAGETTRNIISGNSLQGVLITGASAAGNALWGNYIGTSSTGAASVPNGASGVLVSGGAVFTRLGNFGDGSPGDELLGNVVSGNAGVGIEIVGATGAATGSSFIRGNTIGLSADGSAILGNTLAGVKIVNSAGNLIGSTGAGRNLIAGQTSAAAGVGVEITGELATRNSVVNNIIGTTLEGIRAGNAAGGVLIADGAASNIVGGLNPGEGNSIVNSGGPGIRVIDNASLANAILGNSIHANAGLGIDLKADGVTPNGAALVVRTGPNALQNFPVISGVSSGGQLSATLSGKANTTYRVEFFSSPVADKTGHGEGRTFRGAVNVVTDASGVTPRFTFGATADMAEPWFTATATEIAGSTAIIRGGLSPVAAGTPLNTSEFSLARIINTAPTATPAIASGIEDTDTIITLSGTDPNPTDPLTFKVVSLPAAGQLLQMGTLAPIAPGDMVIDANARVVYRPVPNAHGSALATFSFAAHDGLAESAPATITVSIAPVADTPSITSTSTRRDQQTTSGLVISRNAFDGVEVTHFRISSITSGRVFLNNGVTEVVEGSFITAAQGLAGLKFTPALGFSGTATFQVQASVSNLTSGIGGLTAQASIDIAAVPLTPGITGATTREDTQSTAGLVITPGAGDGNVTSHFKIISISSGSLFLADGATPIAAGSFITRSQAALGLRYSPVANTFGPASISVQASSDATNAGLGGDVVTGDITVLPVADTPGISGASTFENGQSAAGLVITRSPVDGAEVTHFKLISVSQGKLFLADGSTPVNPGAFMTAAQAAAGLRYTPETGYFGPASVVIRAAIGATDDDLGGSPATGSITVAPVNQKPSFAAANVPARLATTTTITIANWAGSFNPGRANEADQTVQAYIVEDVAPAGYFTAAPAVSANGTLSFTAAASSRGTATFRVRVRDTGGTANGGVDTSDAQTFSITLFGGAVCQDVTIDARQGCVPLTVSPGQINITPAPGQGAPTPTVTFSRSLSQPFPIGTTSVIVTLTYPDGTISSCTARVTVQGTDCNNNGVPDGCDISTGVESDCNNNGLPDSCEKSWDNGSWNAALASQANGQLSHEGGGAGPGSKTLDDFYLLPGMMHRLLNFRGQMITNTVTVVRKARLELYEDCDGVPASTPFKVFNNSRVVATTPAVDGFDLVTFSFNLCDEQLWLEGGKTYYAALVGVTDSTGGDLSFWVTTTPGNNPSNIMGQSPFKRIGTQGPTWGSVIYGPWMSTDDCCGGCANMSFSISAEKCKIIWDNGKPQLDPLLATGSPSGADGATLPPPRTADNFIVAPCADAVVCYVEATIFTNCTPPNGFAEIYANECYLPGSIPLFTAQATKVIPLGISATVDGVVLPGYTLVFTNPGWTLPAGSTYWISAGASANGAAAKRSVFAAVRPNCASPGCSIAISPGRLKRPFNALEEWNTTGGEYAFKIAVRTEPEGRDSTPVGSTPSCPADFNLDGSASIDDVFLFLNAWLIGCP